MCPEELAATRKYLWDYFQLHATQRLTTFNFYIVLSTLLTTGLFSTFQKEFVLIPVGVILGLLLVLLSFVFWKLDERNKGLIKNVESGLKYLELQTPSKPEGEVTKIFCYEELSTERIRMQRSVWPWKNLYSYSESFRFIFFLFAALGLIGAIASLYRLTC